MLHGKKITIIAAMGRNRAIGMDGEMPWHLPGELKHFKVTTMGKPIVMGRKTWESIGRVLPGRQNIVVTRNRSYQAPGCDVAASLEEAIELAAGEEVMIIGGGQLYQQAFAFTDRMILTRVDCKPEADTWFPAWRKQGWRRVSLREEYADEINPFDFRVSEWVRKTGVG
ncbi:MAG: dihydrofolate reductase [Xanthomonadales bacterium]|nr:dihydrofolate reductase [Gammaproteobacteria bacterium]MBT8054803.1 dihydrofolate reductase [Gammaproteobacteria bacterium]NND56875.1 dihydrofolate reductase [Xanthomonadales bacterium]NNK51068.1 dihydrofolate reductase [Xanthomonadales bacterium]NNL96158.1 dihydrofolate reductase [Xanthomonadales bacterium]